ncbi:MAG: nuclear transport factor 2 family protein [Oceanospirillaceae bacterium]|nr:nuclear transport factor 2 family protein [Oceanospirillaceae bacterium]
MKSIPKDTSDFSSITAILQNYFDGLHHGDVDKLAAQFHPDAWLKAPGARRSLNQWLTDVSSRPVPAALNKPFAFEILSIDVVQDQAMAKIKCPLFEFNYVDFLGLLKEQGQWRIVTKMYTNIGAKQ